MELLQHAIVTFAAAGAAAFLFRRVFVALRPTKTSGACSSCPSVTARKRADAATPMRLIQLVGPRPRGRVKTAQPGR